MRILFLLICLLAFNFLSAQSQRYTYTQKKMGSPFRLVIYATDSLHANRVATACYRLVDSLNEIFSDYIPDSELNRLCASAGSNRFVVVSPALFQSFLLADEAWRNSKGTFDITIGPLSKLWRKARKKKGFPAADTVSAAIKNVGWSNVLLNKETHGVKLLRKNLQLDLGGIAAGYIAQTVAGFLKTEGISSALVDASGDIVCTDAPPGKKGWTIGINQPGKTDMLLEKYIEVANCSVSTSGDVYQYMEHEGKRYSHIINPQTGYGVTFQRNVTIITKEGAKADWLATACSILSINKVKRLSKKMEAAFLITQLHNGQLKQYSSAGFKNYWQKSK